MTKDKGIYIKNIYYMLSYAFNVLHEEYYENIDKEDFENVYNMFAAILEKGISKQIKQGLYKTYISKTDDLLTLRGKIIINNTVRNKVQHSNNLNCEYDELSENNILNQILKTTVDILLREKSVDKKYRSELKKDMLYFSHIDTLDAKSIRWDRLQYQRNNKNYQILLNICYFIIDKLLMTTDKGNYKMKTFSDEHMNLLFERFVSEYYRKHYSSKDNKYSLKMYYQNSLKWNIENDKSDGNMLRFLPTMRRDITLYDRITDKTLIIDTKYYKSMFQVNRDKESFHSNNLYQIFTYVKNADIGNKGNVAGMLLYAKVEGELTLNGKVTVCGNEIYVRTLDLNKDFEKICRQLNEIIEEYFGV